MARKDAGAREAAEHPEIGSPQLVTAKRARELLGGVSEMHLWRLMCHEA